MRGAFAEPGVDSAHVAAELADELRLLSDWLGLGGVSVARKGDLAAALRGALRPLALLRLLEDDVDRPLGDHRGQAGALDRDRRLDVELALRVRRALPCLFRYMSSVFVWPSLRLSLPLPTTIGAGFFFEALAGRKLRPAATAPREVPVLFAPQVGALQPTIIMWIGPPALTKIRFVIQTIFGFSAPG